ncbi:hypothetical protein INT45_011633 [Circinella minor]|uniref:guanosine-diphosphatase n=1 Tax=Circinella minor TaxID=1195481 RepID=A0A8H7S7D0_9FUNG|nr:hypothetical protein INT45_011633 [Circinella minor]
MNTAKSRKTLLIKCAVGASAILLLLWLLFPNERYQQLSGSQSNTGVAEQQQQQRPSVEHQGNTVMTPDPKTESSADPTTSSSTSPSSPDSEHCSTPHPGRPLIQYALMIDAGSSGSRIHVYRFNFCREQPELEDEVFYPIEPGLSSYKDDAEGAAKSLDELMQVALDKVPADLHHCTPIELKATAGLRLLGESRSKKILDAVRTRLETQYPFPIAGGENGIEIMDGKDEGVYAWITVNYLLGSLKKGGSAAVFDLGGGSTQIVFEPTFDDESAMAEGEHKYLLDYGESQYTLYQHSYLGYGLNEARKRIKNEMIETWKDEAERSGHVYHPCLPANHTETITYGDDDKKMTLIGTGAGHAQCRGVVERVFNKDKICALSPCAFDGMYQPPITETFTARDLYVFSFFYDLTQPLGMPSEFSVQELAELTESVCSGETQPFKHVPDAIEALMNKPDYCLDLTYIHGLLRIGYDVPPERLVRTAKKIRGAETGWCLGASIAMIDEAQICQVN